VYGEDATSYFTITFWCKQFRWGDCENSQGPAEKNVFLLYIIILNIFILIISLSLDILARFGFFPKIFLMVTQQEY
jgi:hypothetical protein